MPQLRQAQPTINEMPSPTKWLPLVTSLSPRVLERGDRARVDAGSALARLGRDARQGRAPHRVAGGLPGLARRREYRALARPGVADNERQIPIASDVPERGSLLVAERTVAHGRIPCRCADAAHAPRPDAATAVMVMNPDARSSIETRRSNYAG